MYCSEKWLPSMRNKHSFFSSAAQPKSDSVPIRLHHLRRCLWRVIHAHSDNPQNRFQSVLHSLEMLRRKTSASAKT